MKKITVLCLFVFGMISLAKAQVSVGINIQNSRNFITVGTDTDKELFGEARLGLGRRTGLELMGGYNFVRKSDVNVYVGAALGLFDHYHPRRDRYYDDTYLAIPFGVFLKPFNDKKFGFVIEAAPVFYGEYGSYLRGGVGFKYTIR
ncbi:outer membrane insertion C- signal [Algoriphagus algorifonticola]|uniref:outer membrane insertion C- signal n=1 Tax=Algoriphagus algorifonticola TaxID=2593007 RepID=UPI0011A77BF1|nr:outer membrane insertion C- signal [Algoriphagus algorifonticola]